MGGSAFSFCNNLTHASFPAVISVGESAFSACKKLTEIFLPNAENVWQAAFNGCISLSKISLPKAKIIGKFVFGSCSNLTSIELPGPTICVAKGDLKIPTSCKIKVPANLIEQYKTATNWSKYASQFVAIQ